jgi:hypothetical protein
MIDVRPPGCAPAVALFLSLQFLSLVFLSLEYPIPESILP